MELIISVITQHTVWEAGKTGAKASLFYHDNYFCALKKIGDNEENQKEYKL